MLLSARDAYSSLETFFEHYMDERDEAIDLPPPRGHLSAQSVVFAYANSNHATIRGVTMDIHPGETVALIGPSGAGKSTMARLLAGILTPRAGTVRIDDIAIDNWQRERIGPYLGYLPQDVELFAGTIAENIGRFTKLDSDAVIEAARLAGVHQLIANLPKAYDTEIGDGGMALSGGQRQRVGLARALYGMPNLLILDEPNANLDNEGEQHLLRVIAHLKRQGVSIIFIAHRPSMLQSADRIVVMRDGQIEDIGTRDEILQKVTRPRGVSNETSAAPQIANA